MSFLLPVTDYSAKGCMCLSTDRFTPELIGAMKLLGEQTSPIYALWGGTGTGERCADRLLSAIAAEADNRALRHINCFSPFLPHRLSALWVDQVGLFVRSEHTLPPRCRLIDLSPLFSPLSDEDERSVSELNLEIAALTEECHTLGSAASRIESAALTLSLPCHSAQPIEKKAARIASAQAISSGEIRTLPILVPHSPNMLLRALPFDASVRIIGLREQYGIAAHFIAQLSKALKERSADFILLTELWSGNPMGIWLPSAKVCYLTDPPESREKIMTLSRYLLPHTQSIRNRYRALEGCRKELMLQLSSLTNEIAGLYAQIDQIEEHLIKKSRFGEFRKRLLIDLFCK